ncbi:hypothetical protein JXM67_04015 [candidate division WOR-3 bacterium]|nr:hypothetical protein [candidate division WOR-3 bacterium]
MVNFIVSLKLLLLALPQAWTITGPDGGMVGQVAVDGSGYYHVATLEGMFKGPDGNLEYDGAVPPGLTELAFVGGKKWACTDGSGLLFKETNSDWQPAQGVPQTSSVVGIVEFGNYIVAATRVSGVYFSEDNGQTFKAITSDWEIPNGAISAIAGSEPGNYEYLGIAFSSPRQLYFRKTSEEKTSIPIPGYIQTEITCMVSVSGEVEGSRYFYIGTEDGITWVLNPLSVPIWQEKMDLIGSSIVELAAMNGLIYAATYGGVLYNTAGNVTGNWQPVTQGEITTPLIFDLYATSDLVCGTSDGVYRLGGSSGWDKVEGLRAHAFTSIDIAQDDASGRIVSSLGGGLYYRKESSTDWGQDAWHVPFAFDAKAGGYSEKYRFYVAGLPGLAPAEMSSGISWGSTRTYPGSGVEIMATVTHVACRPDQPQDVWCITTDSSGRPSPTKLYFNNNYGAAGSDVYSLDLGNAYITDLVYSKNNKMLYIADRNQNDILRLSNPETQIFDRRSFTDGIPVQLAAAGNNLYSLTSTGDIFLSVDNAENWKMTPSQPGNGSITGIAADPSYPNFLFAAEGGSNPVMHASADSGRTWVNQGNVDGNFKCCAAMVAEDMGNQYKIQAYAATHQGVFSETFTLEVGGSGQEKLDLVISVVNPIFRPEIGEVAKFEYGGQDINDLDSWTLEVVDTATRQVLFRQEGGGPSPTTEWDGYDMNGVMAQDAEHRVTFSGSNSQGSGADTTYVKLIIGRPPQSTVIEATKGARKLNQFANKAEICYLSRGPLEAFLAAYNPSDESYLFGYSISNTRDNMTPILTTARADNNTSWLAWVDEISGNSLVSISDKQNSYEFTTGDEKITNIAIAVSATGIPVIAATKEPLGGYLLFIQDTLGLEGDFTEGESVKDIELVPASDGVHTLYLSNNFIHDALWTGPSLGFDRSKDPDIGNSMELTATSHGSDVYLFYLSGSGELFLREYSSSTGWDEPYSMAPHLSGAQPRNITCTVDDEGDLTLAWEEAGNIRFIQRVGGTWSSVGNQTESANTYFPQLPSRVFGTDQPLIAWTEKTAGPINRVQVTELGQAPIEDTLTLTLDYPDPFTHGDTLNIKVHATPPAQELGVWVEVLNEPDEIQRWPASDATIDSISAFFYNTDPLPLGQVALGADGLYKGIPYSKVGAFQVIPGANTPRLSMDFPEYLFRGDTLEITVTSNRVMDYIDVEIELDGGQITKKPDYRDPPEGSSSYPSLYAVYYGTEGWELGPHQLYAEGDTEDDDINLKVYDTVYVREARDTLNLIKEEDVYFVPNPAIQQSTAYIYFELNYAARVTLEIYTVRGKRLLQHQAEDGEMIERGYRSIELDVSELGSDVYLFVFIADAAESTEFQDLKKDIEAAGGDIPDDYVKIVKPFVVVR